MHSRCLQCGAVQLCSWSIQDQAATSEDGNKSRTLTPTWQEGMAQPASQPIQPHHIQPSAAAPFCFYPPTCPEVAPGTLMGRHAVWWRGCPGTAPFLALFALFLLGKLMTQKMQNKLSSKGALRQPPFVQSGTWNNRATHAIFCVKGFETRNF